MIQSQLEIPQPIKKPTEQDAVKILKTALEKEVKTIERFPTGLANFVYDVETTEREKLVVRLARPDLKHFFEGALNWYQTLKEKGVPLPTLYYTSLDTEFPTMIMERLPGQDLILVYQSLTKPQKQELALEIIKIQNLAGTIPAGKGFGYATSKDDPNLKKSWIEVLKANAERSRGRIIKAGILDPEIVERLEKALTQHLDYFSQVKPNCFLHDTTTKNVIISNGKLSGIVDVDSVAYGDPLLTLALTKTSLLARGFDTEYTDYWEQQLNLSSDQQTALNLYSALFSVDFLSEKGHAFNKEIPDEVVQKDIDTLIETFNKHTL